MEAMMVQLSPENAQRLLELAQLVRAKPEEVLNGFLLDELSRFRERGTGIVPCCARSMHYQEIDTALAVASELNRWAWDDGYELDSPLMVKPSGKGGFTIYERPYVGPETVVHRPKQRATNDDAL